MKTPRVPEKVVQSHVVSALRSVGAKVYVIGRPPRRDAVHKGTGQTAGIPDLLVFLPDAPNVNYDAGTGSLAHQLWVECKAKGGRLRPEQADFRARCQAVGIPHVVGGLDEVLAYLRAHGYIREAAHYRDGAA